MENKFFDENNGNENNVVTGETKKGKMNVYEIALAIVGILVLGFALFKLVNSNMFKKNDTPDIPNRATENRQLTENEEEELDPDLYISSEVKSTLDEYCELMDLDGYYISPKMIDADEYTYEMCDDSQCMTTIDDTEKGITYYMKNCNDYENPYKRITKRELDVNTKFSEACGKLDKDGDYTSYDSNSEITCKSYSCNLTYEGDSYQRSCVS